jgi:methyltransferase (TIGR00027 family)
MSTFPGGEADGGEADNDSMSDLPGEITHVSDTALMVAAYRALESESPGGLVRDPFAARLAGERGMAMLRGNPQPEMMRFRVGVRSRFIDELLFEALAAKPITTVLSLGCGLDTRPWRLDLPPNLRWIEVDFPGILDYKERLLSAEAPRCRRERLAADLNDPAERHALFAAAGKAPALMITEGLLMYLPGETVEALAAEACGDSGIAHWMLDVTTDAYAKAFRLDTTRPVSHVQASDSLKGEQILAAVRRRGWVTASRRSYITDLAFARDRIQRFMGDRLRPEHPLPLSPDDPTGIHRLDRV